MSCNFTNCSTEYERDHSGGIGFKYVIIHNLVFLFCNFNNLRSTGFEGAVAFNDPDSNPDDFSIEFQNCKFDNNSVTGNYRKGSSLYINVSFNAAIKKCNFTYQSLNGYGESIYAERSSFIFIENNYFYSSKTSEGNGNVIYLSSGLPFTTIVNNRFIDCGCSTIGSVIESEAKEFIFNDNIIRFTNPNQGTRGILFPCQCKVMISVSTISGCNTIGEGDGLLYRGDISNQPEFIQIETNTFENNNASNGCALLMKIKELPNITACTIKNHISGELIFCIFIQEKQFDKISFKELTFEGNYINQNNDSGGSGIWIESSKYLNNESCAIGFNSCIFRNNRAEKYGGVYD